MTYPIWPKIEPPHPDAVDYFVIGPAEPGPPTDGELDELEVAAERTLDDPLANCDRAIAAHDITRLVAEVRRLRAVLIEERAYHIMFSNLSVLSWRDMPQDQIAMLREAAEVSLHVSTADLHDWLHDTER